MAATMKELGIDRLSVAERLALLQEIWESLSANEDALPLTDAQRKELDRRADEDDANPADVVEWEQVKTEATARWSK